jgi:hypothetical protein
MRLRRRPIEVAAIRGRDERGNHGEREGKARWLSPRSRKPRQGEPKPWGALVSPYSPVGTLIRLGIVLLTPIQAKEAGKRSPGARSDATVAYLLGSKPPSTATIGEFCRRKFS